jgi:hypothetical protein
LAAIKQGLENGRVMRNGQNKRMRGRNNNHGHGHGGHGGHPHGGHRKHHNPMARVYESNGPEVKIRGNPAHIAEKYMQLARDAQTSGDPISAENYYQHAEHYFRLIAAAQEQFRLNNPHLARPETEVQAGARDEAFEDGDDDGQQPGMSGGDRPFGTGEPQPYMPQNAQPFPQYQQPQQHHQQQPNQSYQPRPQQAGEVQGDVGQLPSFITGGQGQPAQNYQGPQGNGQNGYDNQNQGDRFPLHRRRRRHHRGPRHEGGGGGNDGDSSQ